MAVRRERVILDLEDNFSAGIARAAAANKIFGESLEHNSRSLGSYSAASNRAEGNTNRLSSALTGLTKKSQGAGGMLAGVVAGVATLGGPLSAAAVGGIAGISNELGVAAAGAGVFMLAMHGVTTAFQALDNYVQNPSKSTLKAANNALQDLPVSARQFVHQLEAMKPAMDRLRQSAASGLFPGLTEALKTIEQRGPQVNAIVHGLAQAEGELASQAAHALAGTGWDAFFAMWRRDGKSMMLDLGHALGNVAQAMANLWVAFEPLNKSFSKGMVDMTAKLDRWTAGLSKTKGFQEFLDYVRANGPLLLDTLGKVAKLFLDVAVATAPLGGPVLHAVGDLADVLDRIAKTDIAKPFVIAAAAAYTLNTLTSGRLANGIKGLVKGGAKGSAAALAGDLVGNAKPVPVYVVNWGGKGGGLPGATPSKGGITGKIEGATTWFGKHPFLAAVGQAGLITAAAATAEEITRRIIIPETKKSLIQYQAGLGLGINGGDRTGQVGVQDKRTPLQNQVANAFGNYNIASSLGILPGYKKATDLIVTFNQATNKFTVDSKKAQGELVKMGVSLGDIIVKAKKPIKVDADTTGARSKVTALRNEAHQPITIPASLDLSPAQRQLQSFQNQMRTSGIGGGVIARAGGGMVPGPRYPYGDKVLAHLAPGEEVITNRHGEADRYRADRAAGRIPAYANGGTVQRLASGGTALPGGNLGQWLMAHPGNYLAQEFYTFSAALRHATSAVNTQTTALNNWKQQADALRSNTLSMFTGNPWQNTNAWMSGGGVGSVFTQLGLDTRNANSFTSLAKRLGKRGLHGAALDAAETQGLDALRALSTLSKHDLARYQSMFDARNRAAAVAGSTAYSAYSGEIAHSNHLLNQSLMIQKQMNARLLGVQYAIKPLANQFAAALNKQAAAAAKRGHP